MTKRLIQRFSALMLSSLITMTPLTAYEDCSPCVSSGYCECWGVWDIGVDFLWWKGCVDNLGYATAVTTDDSGAFHIDEKSVCPEWTSGFRFNVTRTNFLCDWDLVGSFSYNRIRGSDACATPAGLNSNLYSNLIPASLVGDSRLDNISSNYSALFYQWDLLFVYRLDCSNPCIELHPIVGLAGLTLNQEQKSVFSKDNAVTGEIEEGYTDNQTKVLGLGLKLGTNLVYTVTKDVQLFGRATGEILTAKDSNGKNIVEITNSATTSYYQFKRPECYRIIPGYHLQLGVQALSSLCGPEMGIRVGYEFIRYFNVPTVQRFIGDQFDTQAALSTSADVTTFGTHGLFIGAEISF